MKLRLTRDTLRLRLTSEEIREFQATGRLEERVAFGPDPDETFRYVLERSPGSAELGARLKGPVITVYVPPALAHAWAPSPEPGAALTNAGAATGLRVIVEKDKKPDRK